MTHRRVVQIQLLPDLRLGIPAHEQLVADHIPRPHEHVLTTPIHNVPTQEAGHDPDVDGAGLPHRYKG